MHPLAGWSIPTILSLSLHPALDLGLGLSVAIYLTYIHQPQFLSEILFLRSAQVLAFNFHHLKGHLDCCIHHKKTKGTTHYQAKTPSAVAAQRRANADCCLGHSNNLLKLFRKVEETFQNQLLIQLTLIMSTLIFGNKTNE